MCDGQLLLTALQGGYPMTDFDLVIIGAGPAGMAAAIEADRGGASVLVLDEQQHPGGQIYRNITHTSKLQSDVLGDDYQQGREIASQFLASSCEYLPASTVWKVSNDARVVYSRNHHAAEVHAKRIIIANGALERPMPIPGWTLPGVMTAGAAQILLKGAGVTPQDAVLVGCGPLLYLLAVQLIQAGSPPRALIETQNTGHYRAALRYLPAALAGWPTLTKGLSLLHVIRKAGIPRYRGADRLVLTGDTQVTAVEFTQGNKAQQIACDNVLLHQGVIPNTQISESLQLTHRWHTSQQCFVPVVDAWGVSSNSHILIAGDGAAINGAISAAYMGKKVALQCLASLGLMSTAERDQQVRTIQLQIKRQQVVRPFLEALYAPSQTHTLPDDTVVCRCEKVTAGDIRRYASLGCVGPNQTKAFGRSGMGPCQGRYCGVTVTALLAESNGLTAEEVGSYRIRSPIKPVTLGELASLHSAVNESAD